MASGSVDLERSSGRSLLVRLRARLRSWVRALETSTANQDLFRVELARFASVTGRWAYTVTFAIFAYRSGGAEGVAIAGIVRLAPAAITAPVTGALIGRVRADALLLRGGVVRTLALAGAGVIILDGGASWVVYALVAVESAVSALMRPAQTSLLPALARTPEELTAANLALSVIESAGVFLGPLLGALLIHGTGAGVVFLTAAAAYLASTLVLASVRVSVDVPVADTAVGLVGDLVAGVRAVAANRNATVVVLLYGAQSFVAGVLNVLVVVVALRLLGFGQSGVGTLTAAIGVGGMVGGALIFLRLQREAHGADLRLGLLLWGTPLLLAAAFPSRATTLLLFGVVGVGVTIVDVSTVTLLQRLAAGEVLSHALGLLQTVVVVGMVTGTLVAPPLISHLGPRGALVATGAVLPILATALWGRLRRLDARPPANPAYVKLLSGIPIFEPLADVALEQLASVLEPVAIRARQPVFAQGDPGDAFYVVEEGRLDVVIDDASIRELGPGDYFGEIALLRDVPRTATVIPLTPTNLLALDRDQFLGTVTGNSSSARAADAVVGARLGLRAGFAPL
jgi:Cyclic nucleotide-binding domain